MVVGLLFKVEFCLNVGRTVNCEVCLEMNQTQIYGHIDVEQVTEVEVMEVKQD